MNLRSLQISTPRAQWPVTGLLNMPSHEGDTLVRLIHSRIVDGSSAREAWMIAAKPRSIISSQCMLRTKCCCPVSLSIEACCRGVPSQRLPYIRTRTVPHTRIRISGALFEGGFGLMCVTHNSEPPDTRSPRFDRLRPHPYNDCSPAALPAHSLRRGFEERIAGYSSSTVHSESASRRKQEQIGCRHRGSPSQRRIAVAAYDSRTNRANCKE